jgi:hypothetical protein
MYNLAQDIGIEENFCENGYEPLGSINFWEATEYLHN